MSSPKSPKTALSKLGLNRPKPIRILVLGQNGVGKSALVVRYMTRRFIGEYDSCLEKIYSFMATYEDEPVCMEILDSAGKSHENNNMRLEANIRWADTFILIYSVTDKCSFDDSNRLKFLINYNKRKRRISSSTAKDFWWEVPVILVGNKNDLQEDRMVSTDEGLKRCQDIGCATFHEISARENIDEIEKIFMDAVKYWRDVCKFPKIRRTSSEFPVAEFYASDTPINRGPLPAFSSRTSSEGLLTDLILRLRYGGKDSHEESNDITFPDIGLEQRAPYRGRASTDSWLHHRRMNKLRVNLRLRGSLLHERRMSIAMRGESIGF